MRIVQILQTIEANCETRFKNYWAFTLCYALGIYPVAYILNISPKWLWDCYMYSGGIFLLIHSVTTVAIGLISFLNFKPSQQSAKD